MSSMEELRAENGRLQAQLANMAEDLTAMRKMLATALGTADTPAPSVATISSKKEPIG